MMHGASYVSREISEDYEDRVQHRFCLADVEGHEVLLGAARVLARPVCSAMDICESKGRQKCAGVGLPRGWMNNPEIRPDLDIKTNKTGTVSEFSQALQTFCNWAWVEVVDVCTDVWNSVASGIAGAQNCLKVTIKRMAACFLPRRVTWFRLSKDIGSMRRTEARKTEGNRPRGNAR